MEANTSRRQQILRLLLERDDFICGICNVEIDDVSQCNIDHILPRSKGGSNESTNLQPAHIRCNYAKADKVPVPLVYKPKRKNIDQAVILEEQDIQRVKDVRRSANRDANYQFVSDAIARKKRADEFLDGVLAKQKEAPPTPKKIPKKIPLIVEKVNSDAPVRLWNELARNQYKNLSWNLFVEFFDEYRKAPSEFISR